MPEVLFGSDSEQKRKKKKSFFSVTNITKQIDSFFIAIM